MGNYLRVLIVRLNVKRPTFIGKNGWTFRMNFDHAIFEIGTCLFCIKNNPDNRLF